MIKSKGIKKSAKLTLNNSQRLVFGSFLVLLGVVLFFSIVSFFFTGESDQSTLVDFGNRTVPTKNWLSKLGAWLSHLLVFKGFGVASLLFAGLLLSIGNNFLILLSLFLLYWIPIFLIIYLPLILKR